MSISAEIKKLEHYELKHRSGIERFATLTLTALTLFSLTELGHGDDKRNINRGREAIVQQSVVFNPAEKNETVRMPVKFDDGLRATATSGF